MTPYLLLLAGIASLVAGIAGAILLAILGTIRR